MIIIKAPLSDRQTHSIITVDCESAWINYNNLQKIEKLETMTNHEVNKW